MRITRMLLGSVAVLMLLAAPLTAQEKPREAVAEIQGTALKVQVVFSETQGDRKISSLPYVLHLLTQSETSRFGDTVKLRMGVRVPIPMGEKTYQYFDIGTNIDCRARRFADGRIWLFLNLSRTSSYAVEDQQKPGAAEATGLASAAVLAPIMGNFSSELNLILQDNQTMQSLIATDPVSGRTLKVDVTLTVVK